MTGDASVAKWLIDWDLLPRWASLAGSGRPSGRLQPWERPAAATATRVSFRFGLSGLRWGHGGPAVLMMHGPGGRPTQFRYFIDPVVASGRQVIALDGGGASAGEAAMTLLEAAVEMPELEAVVGHGLGATGAAIALAQGLPAERAVLIASPRQAGDPGEPEARPLARRLAVPTLVVHDFDDREAPFAEGEALARELRQARLLATSGLGHWGVLTDPVVTQGVAEFLAGHAAGLTVAQLRALEAPAA